jgi:nucleoside-diphosphate-sugar epimerase
LKLHKRHGQVRPMENHLLSFGHGYSAQALAKLLLPKGWQVTGTTRDPAKLDQLSNTGVIPALWGSAKVDDALKSATAILISTSPDDAGDPVFLKHGADIAKIASGLKWFGYLSTSGVYGDFKGDWVDEDTIVNPTTRRGKMRLLAEKQWSSLDNLPLHIFRLAGIYGPGRGPFSKVRAGTAQRVVKPGQVFSRIHIDDIAQTLVASILSPNPTRIYNLCDDDPAPPQDVIGYAAELIGAPLPPLVPFEKAELGPMARSFYAENKRIRNDRIKKELGVSLKYPTYKLGLKHLLETE